MRAEDEHPVHLDVDMAVYRPTEGSRPARLEISLLVDRDPNPANGARLRTAQERLWSDSDQVAASFTSATTRHLQEQSTTTAFIVDDGYGLRLVMDVPSAAPKDQAEAAAGKAGPSLTNEQQDLLRPLASSIHASLPVDERHRADSLVLQAVRQIPPVAEVISAYDRVQVSEVIDEHIERMKDHTQMPVPDALRLAGLSFPHPPSAALNYYQTEPAAAAASTVRHHRSSTALER